MENYFVVLVQGLEDPEALEAEEGLEAGEGEWVDADTVMGFQCQLVVSISLSPSGRATYPQFLCCSPGATHPTLERQFQLVSVLSTYVVGHISFCFVGCYLLMQGRNLLNGRVQTRYVEVRVRGPLRHRVSRLAGPMANGMGMMGPAGPMMPFPSMGMMGGPHGGVMEMMGPGMPPGMMPPGMHPGMGMMSHGMMPGMGMPGMMGDMPPGMMGGDMSGMMGHMGGMMR